METVQLKHCPICNQELPVSEFGIVRARKDGRNLYDKACIRAKTNAARKALREYKANRKKYQAQGVEYFDEAFEPKPRLPLLAISKKAPVEKVLSAIRRGYRTQAEIGRETKLGKDEIGDAIANLLLWSKEIRTQVIDGTRMYFLNAAEEKSVIEIDSVPFFDIARTLGAPRVHGEKRMKRAA